MRGAVVRTEGLRVTRFLPIAIAWAGRFALALAVAGILLLGLVFMTLQRGEAAMARSDAAFDAGRLEDALEEARVAAACAVPLGSHLVRAEARLISIAMGAEGYGDDRLARRAWAAVRGAALERRHPWGSEPTLEQADRQLARLLAAANAEKKERVFTEAELLIELRESRPSNWASLWGGLALVPLFAALGLVFAPQRRPGPVGEEA